MEKMPSREKISMKDANDLKHDILAGGFGDNTEIGEMITAFLAARGYGVDREAMPDLIKIANQGSLGEFKEKLGTSALES